MSITPGITVSPDGSMVYIGYAVGVGSFHGGALALIDTATDTQVPDTNLPSAWIPNDLTVSPNGNIYAGALEAGFNGTPPMYEIMASNGTILPAVPLASM
jgi:sugar lactone lactonase YvrE